MSTSEMKDEAGARPQVVYETTVGADHVIGHRVQLRDLNVEGRLVQVVRQLEAQADTGGAERNAQVGADAEIQRELRFDAQFVDSDEKRLFAAPGFGDRNVRVTGGTPFDEHLQRRADVLLDVVGNPAKSEKDIRPD